MKINDFEYSFPEETNGPDKEARIMNLHDAIGDMSLWPEGEYSKNVFHGHFLTRNRKRSWTDPSYTIVAHSSHIPLHPMGEPMIKIGKDHWVLSGTENRRLSWRECAAIQGLPQSIEIDGGLDSKYKVVGNSVPPKLAEVVARPVVDYLQP